MFTDIDGYSESLI